MLLARDTALTEYHFSGGEAVGSQVVLQAGSAVLVDSRGVPRVRCISGDPLAPSHLAGSLKVSGDRWDGFAAAQVIVVTPTPKPVPSVPAEDITTGKPVPAPLGGTVSLDGYLVSDAKGVSVVSFDGKTRTTVIDHPVAKAIDDGAGGIIYQELHTSGRGASGADLNGTAPFDVETRMPATADEAAIWHLASGTTKPTKLISAPDYQHVWYSIESSGVFNGHRVLAYLSTPEKFRDLGTGSDHQQALHIYDLVDGSDRIIDDYVAGYESYFAGISILDDLLVYRVNAEGDTTWNRVTSDFHTDHDLCVEPTSQNRSDPCSFGDAYLADGSIAGLRADDSGALSHDVAVADPKSGSVERQVSGPQGLDLNATQEGTDRSIDQFGSRFLVSDYHFTTGDATKSTTTWYDLDAGTSTPLDIAGITWILRKPLLISRGPKATTTAPAAQQAPTWDEIKNASIPGECGLPPTTLVDGKNTTLGNDETSSAVYQRYYELDRTIGEPWGKSTGVPGLLSGLPSDAGPLTAVVVSCNLGGPSGMPNMVAAFSAGGKFYDGVGLGPKDSKSGDPWAAAGFDGPAREGITRLELRGPLLVVHTLALLPGECEACASGHAEVTFSARDGSLHFESVTKVADP